MRFSKLGIPFLFSLALASSAASAPTKFALGIGYPDVRERLSLLPALDWELKAAFVEHMQAYSTRLYVLPFEIHGLRLVLGAEAGALNFDGRQGLSGHGLFAQPFAGFDFRFAGNWMVNIDIGPAWIRLVSQGQAHEFQEWTYNTALYYYLF